MAQNNVNIPSVTEIINRVEKETKQYLQVDEQYTVDHDDGFTWWSHRYAHRFTVRAFTEQGNSKPTHVMLSCVTDYLRGVHAQEGVIERIIDAPHVHGMMSSSHIADGRYQFRSRVPIALNRQPKEIVEAIDVAVQVVAGSVITANHVMYPLADQICKTLQTADKSFYTVNPDITAHPVSGARGEKDILEERVKESFTEGKGRMPFPGITHTVRWCSERIARNADNSIISNGGAVVALEQEIGGRRFNTIGIHGAHPGLGWGLIVNTGVDLSEADSALISRDFLTRLTELDWSNTQASWGTSGWVHSRTDLPRIELDPFSGTESKKIVEAPRLSYYTFYPVAFFHAGLADAVVNDHIARVRRVGAYLEERLYVN